MPDDVSRPGYQDVRVHLDSLEGQPVVEVREIGRSVQDRPIRAAILTDPTAPADDKQHVLIVAGQHGSEESGRAMAMATMDFLVGGSEEAAEILRKQVVAFVPCANPDGAVADTGKNADGDDIAHTWAYDEPAQTVEARALEGFAAEFIPDVSVDIHGRAGGGMKELAWVQPGWGFSSDRYFVTAMSLAMAEAGEAAGFPQCELSPAGRLEPGEGHHAMLGSVMAYRYKTLALGLESIEQYYRLAQWRATGAPRQRRLLRFGNEDAFGLGAAGYPNALVSGNRIYGLMAHGATAAQRRASRVELLAFLKRNFTIADRGADGKDRCCKITVSSKTCDGDNPQRFALLARIKNPCTVNAVTWDGEALAKADGPHGWRSWTDSCSTFVQASLTAPFGGPQRRLVVDYDCPYFE